MMQIRRRGHYEIACHELVMRPLRRGAVVLHGQQFGGKIRGRHEREIVENGRRVKSRLAPAR